MARHGELATVAAEVVDDSSSRWGELAGLTVESFGSAVILNPITAQTAQPGETVTIVASLTEGEPDTWTWLQTSGPDVDFEGDGTATISFAAPATTNGAVLNFTVDGTRYSTTVTTPATVTVRPQQWWQRTASGVVPIIPQVP